VIVIDSSALLGILQHEADREVLFHAIADADRRLISAVNYQESAQIQFSKRGAQGTYDLDDFLTLIGAEIIPHDRELARFAVEAFKRYGKGIHPDARLNFCDCAAYALAKSLDVPLLFKGNDFAATDLRRAV
jgi:ribonuclease VapC